MDNNNLNEVLQQALGSSPALNNPTPQEKIKVLVWSDCVLATTGFGIVSKNILHHLHATGKYEIDQLAINHPGDFQDQETVPYSILPAKLKDPRDPYGQQMLINALQRKDYDILFIINDTFVVDDIGKVIPKIKHAKFSAGRKVFKVICYYPVDCALLPQLSSILKTSDHNVAYTNFAAEKTKVLGDCQVDSVIYHGTDISLFHKVAPDVRKLARAQFLHISSDDKFVWMNVNRNSLRKDIARSLLAFSKFRKVVPNSMMYVHARILDSPSGTHPLDLEVAVKDLGLDISKDIIFPNPKKYSSGRGFPGPVLNQIYNCADGFITTHLGEGWGLTITEAMSVQIPVVAPCNTTTPEILGPAGERGYVYPCKEHLYMDNIGYRPVGHIDDIVEQMLKCYGDWKNKNARYKKKLKAAREFVEEYSWENVCKGWVEVFDQVLAADPTDGAFNAEGESV